MAVDRRVLQSPAMQALVEEMEWMLARRTQQLRAERLAARAHEKRQLRRARKQELRDRCKRTLNKLNRSSLRCYCHDFACWQYLWKRDSSPNGTSSAFLQAFLGGLATTPAQRYPMPVHQMVLR